MTEDIDFDPTDILDMQLDDLADAPEFLNGGNTPRGTYLWLLNAGVKKINDDTVVEFTLNLKGVEELVNPEEESKVPALDSTASFAFFLKSEFGVGRMKKHLKVIADHFELENPPTRDLLAAIEDLEVRATVGYRKNKDDPEAPHLDLKALEVL